MRKTKLVELDNFAEEQELFIAAISCRYGPRSAAIGLTRIVAT
jgi:hypothetical protein